MAATATPYVSGIKKPMNMLENPIYPDIKKGPPRFVWSKKYWQVDPGATLRDTEEITQFTQDAVLAQSRDYNKTVYGQSSHRDVVNAAFRPPLLDPIDDFFPLSRIPVTSRAIVPLINPSTVADGEGTNGYLAKNERINNIDKHVSDRVKQGEWRPTFYAPIEIPKDNSVLPDLEMVIPSISASSGFNFPTRDAPIPEVHLDYEKIDPRYNTGYNTQVQLNSTSGLENMQLDYNAPQVSATAGINTPYQANIETYIRDIDLEYNIPSVSATAGINAPYDVTNEFQKQREYNLETHIEAPISVTNPGTENGYKSRLDMLRDSKEYISQSIPNYSYVIPETVLYREQNEMTYKPHFQTKLEPMKSYGNISHASAFNKGFEVQRYKLRGESGWANTPKLKNYSFGR